jgi:hypothetical protein
MRHEDDYIEGWRTKRVDNSRPPLRWIANIFGEIGGWAIMKVAILEEEENFGLRYKLASSMYSIFMPLYMKYGTFYKIDIEDREDI